MALAVENPIVNSPFSEPFRYWDYKEGQPHLIEGRRPAGYYLLARTRTGAGPLAAEEFVPLELVNAIREKVKKWRENGYRGVTPVTRELLRHWTKGERERPLFFCQREAAETVIWLIEAPAAEKQGIVIPQDAPDDPESLAKGYPPLKRYGCKMATGSGKTVAMAMLIAWSVLNKVAYRNDRRFSDAVLVVCPNLTVKERLQVLNPAHPKNYYEAFELVPRPLLGNLRQGKFLITNWNAFLPVDDSRKKSVLQRGPESDRAFCNRVLGKELGNKENILVVNDEAHHAYRPAQDFDYSTLSDQELKELEEEFATATVWVNGLDRINSVRRINFCLDFSATPFYLKGSGHPEGTPFPWVVSDFGLVDAIESGIVKIPRVPVDDNSGSPDPRYFRLWEEISRRLPAKHRETARRQARPEAVLREAEGALLTIASEWRKTFLDWQEKNVEIPPAMIVVCASTGLAREVHEYLARGYALPELKNQQNAHEVTIRVDTKLLAEAEIACEGETKGEAAERLRKTVATVGKVAWEGEGEPPGKNVRCVVSVSMLSEGWDAPNVTQILGLRAFSSQLLCEQVVGRGLRRTSYDDFSEPEYVDVYGVPFEVIPVMKKSSVRSPTEKPSTLVRALPERKHLEITFPRVEGYIFDVRHRIKVNMDELPELVVDPSREPTEVIAKDAVGYRLGRRDRLGPGVEVVHDRNPFHATQRLQATVYRVAAEITNRLQIDARRFLFPQVLEIVWSYLEQKLRFIEAPPEEVALRKYLEIIVERLTNAIEPDTSAGEPPLRPIVERYRPLGSTGEVLFRTKRPCFGTAKSHLSHVVADSPVWEHSVAYQLERLPFVYAYAKNDHLDFVIPYQFEGISHDYRPDFLVRVKKSDGVELKVILEVKGLETERDRAKEVAARRWVRAVNYDGQFGRWAYLVCKEPARLKEEMEKLIK